MNEKKKKNKKKILVVLDIGICLQQKHVLLAMTYFRKREHIAWILSLSMCVSVSLSFSTIFQPLSFVSYAFLSIFAGISPLLDCHFSFLSWRIVYTTNIYLEMWFHVSQLLIQSISNRHVGEYSAQKEEKKRMERLI